ncbi:bleomycin hydrolase [Pseudohyphozyma bogoriensis]|nr:bleomycin hydrolase [Pseudohyphozyma bogoriensis]
MVLRPVQDPAVDGEMVLNVEDFAEWEDSVQRDPVSQLAQTVFAGSKRGFLPESRDRLVADVHVLNILRVVASRRYKLEDFQLSQSYVFFMSHMAKANSFLEQVLNMCNLSLESREMTWLFANGGVQDGGDYDLAVSLITEFGLVPRTVFPETWASCYTIHLDTIISTKLRDFALNLRQAYEENLNRGENHAAAVQKARKLKRGMFVWEFEDKNKKYRKLVMTPLEFAQSLGHGLEQTMVLANDPRNPFGVAYCFQGGGAVIERRMSKHINVPIEEMKAAAIKQLQVRGSIGINVNGELRTFMKANIPVWFGADVLSNYAVAQKFGIMDTKFFDLEKAYSIEVNMDKAERLRTGDSASNHAMVFTGVHLDDNGKPVRWRVENSWGPKACNHGFLVMTDEFFDEFIYQVAAPKAVVPRQLVNVYEQAEPVMLPPWDAMAWVRSPLTYK